MCNYCNWEYYIKTQKYAKSYSAPMTLSGQLRQQLEDLTGEQFLIIPNQYCPMCGANLKEVGGMKIWSKSKIGSDGIQRITVEIKPARLNSFDLFEGGEYINFEIDHKKQRTFLWQMSFRNGVSRFEEKALKVYKGEIIDSDKECLEIVKKIKAV